MPVANLGTTVDSLYPPQPKSLLPLHDERDTVIQSRGGSLFGCASDCYTCCLGYCCPCVLFGRTLKRSGISDSGCFGVALFAFIVLLYTAGLVFGALQFACSFTSDNLECQTGAQVYAGFALLAFYVVSGIVFGYYRERVKSMLVGGSSSQLTLSSFLLHCCPLTSACAFCQEARSVDNDMSSYS